MSTNQENNMQEKIKENIKENIKDKDRLNSTEVMQWAKCGGYVAKDVSKAILGFIPTGLNKIYDQHLKTMKISGWIFAHRWVEQSCKLCFGITIGQGLAHDIAHFIFWPIGYMIGALIGSLIANKKTAPTYHGQIGKTIDQFAVPAMSGALIGTLLLGIIHLSFPELLAGKPFSKTFLLFSLIGTIGGIFFHFLLWMAVQNVQENQALVISENVKKAKELNNKLKIAARLKAKSKILIQAQDIIQQVNGAQAQQYLEAFFEEQYDNIAASTHQKIDRHFNYLTDRACHGDLKALQRLKDLTKGASSPNDQQKSTLDEMLERIFNARAIAKIKDEVDTVYDRWHYRFLLSL